MRIQILKKLNDSLPDFIKIVFAPVIRRKLIYNKVFQRQMIELIEIEKLSEEDKNNRQLMMLRKVIIHAYNHIPYYKNIMEQAGIRVEFITKASEQELLKAVKRIPILTKTIIKDNFEEIQADNIDDYYIATTGGSTGEPLTILLDRDSIYKEKAFIYHFWSKAGYDFKSSRLATFRGLEFHGKYSKINSLYNEIVLNPFQLNEETLPIYLNKIKRFKADFIHGYPSAIYAFCKLVQKRKIDLSGVFKAIFFISENIYEFERDYIEKTLNCKSYAFYGHSERAVFAEQLTEEYLFHPMYGYVEIGDNSEIICTGFLNQKMPMIRYCLDDQALKYRKGYKIYGHHGLEVLIGKNGERISSAMINFHSDVMKNVLSYQFIQNEKGKAELYVILETSPDKATYDKITKEVNDKIGSCIKVEVHFAEQLQLSSRGKYKMIIQNIKDK